MDTLIRAAQLAPFRTRLSETRVGQPGAAPNALPGARQTAQGRLDTLRIEIEKQVRTDLAAQMQKLCDSERATARREGYADGRVEAARTAAKEREQAYEELKANVDRALSAMEQAHRAALSRLESSVGEVAFAAVCRLVSGERASQAFVLGLVEHTCAQVRADAMATARLHPRDIAILHDLLQDQELRVQSLGVTVIADESLELGGCVVEAASGHYDGGLETQLRRLHAVLVGPPTESAVPASGAGTRLTQR